MKKLLTLVLVAALAYGCGDSALEDTVSDMDSDTTSLVVEDLTPVEYDTVATVRHILIAMQSQTTGEVKTMEECATQTADIIAKIQAGEPWENFIQASDDVGSIPNGGVYENIKRGTMVPPFDVYPFDADLNVLGSVSSQYGMHVIEVLERNVIVRRKEYKFGPATYYAGDSVATVRHILIGHGDLGNRTVEAAKAKADSVFALLEAGQSFDQLVTACSDDPGSVETKGVYESFPRGLMVPSFENYSFGAPYNQVGIVETAYGFHIVEVLSREIKE